MEIATFFTDRVVGFLPKVEYVNYDSVGVVLRGGKIQLTFDFHTNDAFLNSKKRLFDYRRCRISWTVSRVGMEHLHNQKNLNLRLDSDPEIAKYLGISLTELKLAGSKAERAFLAQFE
jgi:hypothetical protein